MKNMLLTLCAALLVLGLAPDQAVRADSYPTGGSYTVGQTGNELFSAEELEDLLAPIALYPDPLLAQVLPAATFIEQIDEAARYVKQYGKTARIDDQPWDVSVKAVAYYPGVLFMMDQKYDWTVSLGQAFVNQPEDVMDAVQRLRAEAWEMGNLASTPQQQVLVEDGVISIVPAEPEVIYVPVYDPLAVYVESPPVYGFITFGIGFPIGAWLNRDCDWHGHRVYYHGWRGTGWIGRARPHIQVRNSVYIDNIHSVVSINRRVVQRATATYREELRHNVQNRSERLGRTVSSPGNKVETRGGAPRPASAGDRSQESSDSKDVYRGRDVRKELPASRTGYGGYGSSRDASTYRERGQTSRENMRQVNRPAPVERPAIPGGRQTAPAPAMQPAPHVSAPSNPGGRGQRR